MDTRRATSDDLERIDQLLEQEGAARLPRGLALANVLVGLGDDELLGAVAMEVRERTGLVRAIVVDPAHRRKGVGSSLVESLVARCHELGLRELYVASGHMDGESSAGFAERMGFAAVEEAELPRSIRAAFPPGDDPDASVLRFALATRW